VDPFQFEITFECIHPLEEGERNPLTSSRMSRFDLAS